MGLKLVEIGLVLILIGFALVFVGSVIGGTGKGIKVAVGGFLGPIPFGFGNDPQMAKLALGISIAMLLIFLVLPLILRYVK